MKYSNELKVGLAVVLAVTILVLGTRFFLALPLFDRTISYQTSFENASGLVSGNPVRVHGVRVGSVERIQYDPQLRGVRVSFYVDPDITIPEGSTAEIAGFGAIGDLRLNLRLGPPDNPPIEPGGFVPSDEDDLLADITERAPYFLGRIDTTLMQLESTMRGMSRLVDDPDAELRQALTSIGEGADAVSRVLNEEQQRMATTLDSVAHLTGSINRVIETNEDTLAQTISNVNQVVARLDQNLAHLEATTHRMNSIMEQVENGEGSLGLLVNDPGLYNRMDSTMVRVNSLIEDFQQNPRRYLREITIFDFF